MYLSIVILADILLCLIGLITLLLAIYIEHSCEKKEISIGLCSKCGGKFKTKIFNKRKYCICKECGRIIK